MLYSRIYMVTDGVKG